MKKRLIAILAVASIILTSCANEKQKEETNSQFYSVTNIEELLIADSTETLKYDLKENSNLDISEELYEKLLKKKISNIITKTRIVVPIPNNLEVEMDIYYGYLQGLLTAEVQFPNEEQANDFDKPDWLGEEIGYKEFSNRKLAEISLEEFRDKVSDQFIENNQKIIEELNQFI